ncbi:hypothetical protein EV701_13314 [Chthoniobacter flavus]|uniref:hypothetical protein n=1 Tax=Chthoniobacter flavus TaxID=191863 RepID=UPI00104F0EB0|nr:hypothetical protein [Chthoniobacter flavus]TCO84894.1 hypothetical protein EV701_13314 [Chthoniobacter flavus]
MHESLPPASTSHTALPFAPQSGLPARLPHSVLFVALVLILFLGLLTLEISDSYFRHDHAIARSLFVLPLPAALFWGICTRHRWAWWTTRILALLVAILYALPSIGIWFLYPHLPLGLRLWITVVGAILCAFVLSVHLALGRPAARTYFFARKTGH